MSNNDQSERRHPGRSADEPVTRLASTNPPLDYSWLPQICAHLVCGLSCRAVMSYRYHQGTVLFDCARHCERRQPVWAVDVVDGLLRVLSQLRCMAGLSDNERLHRIGEAIEQVTIHHGAAMSIRWPQRVAVGKPPAAVSAMRS